MNITIAKVRIKGGGGSGPSKRRLDPPEGHQNKMFGGGVKESSIK